MTAAVARLPCNAAERRQRALDKLFAREDALQAELRKLREEIRPLQRQVSLDRGFLFTVSREVLARPGRGGTR
jgi:hypothetical protein